MVKSIVGVLPWAVALVALGGALWWLLAREMAAGRWLLAALLIGHGLIHLLFLVPAPAATDSGPKWPFDMGRSWAASRAGLGGSAVRIVGAALIAVVVVGFSLAALSTVGIVIPSGWWQPLVAVSSVASAALLVLCFEPQLVLGLGIDAALLWVVAAGAWLPA
jgi:hypothetical protein